MNRRAFLLGSAAAIASTAVPSVPSLAWSMSDEELLKEIMKIFVQENEYMRKLDHLIIHGSCTIVGAFNGFEARYTSVLEGPLHASFAQIQDARWLNEDRSGPRIRTALPSPHDREREPEGFSELSSGPNV